MIDRLIADFARKNASWFPVVSITGPQQSGKSTLVQHLFPDYTYLNLEDQPTYERIAASPADFIHEHPDRMIIDEAQRIPDLFNAIQVESDKRGSVGQYILSGSQNFLLLRNITQTLAGRVGLVRLLPLSYREALSAQSTLTPDQFAIKGGYPRLYDVDIPTRIYYANYLSTYVERDAAGYLDAKSISAFTRFIGLCAQSCGSLLNVSRFANDLGISRSTVNSWLSLLEASYTIFLLQPYHANLRKRLTKTPKLYFHDCGLLCHLLGIETVEQLVDSPMKGTIFEDLIIEETMKRHLNNGREPQLFFYRDDSKVEVDLVDCTLPGTSELVEIKSNRGFQQRFLRHLPNVGEALDIPEDRRFVVTRSDESYNVTGTKIWSAQDWLLRG